VTPQLRISKMFSKSSTHMDHVRPFWFTATTQPKAEALTLTTVLTLDEWDQLKRLTEIWQGTSHFCYLARIRREYDASPSLQQYVDLHLVIRPDARHEEFPIFSTGGMQEARNLARLFSRSKYFVAMPVTTLWTTNLTNAVEEYKDILDEGDVLVVPTFAFPRRHNGMIETSWPKEREGIIEWVRAGRMGMLDYHWPMNRGPSSWPEWQEAEEAYLVTEYDFHYNPVYIATRDDHPWCEERFEDQLSACVYSMFLAGSDLFVLHDNFIVRTGQEPEDKLTETERAMQVAFYKNFRIEQCVFYARQFDQNGLFDTEIASHVKQECAKALGSLQKEKMIGKPHQH
ncbi:uncharacterized protein BYT42DRAFT_488413, partial [Radiomyces spectabilis]|uniref:uncharacterized protein n=1 Tax=Radiomyces spectabilis TaxID=64574 RepID=UPI00221EF22F